MTFCSLSQEVVFHWVWTISRAAERNREPNCDCHSWTSGWGSHRKQIGGSEDVMHKCTEKSQIPIYRNRRCREAPVSCKLCWLRSGKLDRKQSEASPKAFLCSELPLQARQWIQVISICSPSVFRLCCWCWRLHCFVWLCCQQIDGAAAQIDRSRLSQPLA